LGVNNVTRIDPAERIRAERHEALFALSVRILEAATFGTSARWRGLEASLPWLEGYACRSLHSKDSLLLEPLLVCGDQFLYGLLV
jgi:hypothetical protein